jgi:pimeloyl-ACP methyl ester carboxylesterase
MPIMETARGPIELIEQGEGDDLAVLLHAAASGPRALHRLASALAAAGLGAAAPALHKYGGTRLSGAAEPVAAHVEVAGLVLDARPARRQFLFGHSMGGLVALLAMLGGRRVDGAILYEPIVLDALDPADPGDREARDWDRAVIARLSAAFAAGDPEPGVAAFVEAYNEVRWGQLPAPLRAELVANAGNLVAEVAFAQRLVLDRARLAALETPVLILQGERSPDVTQRMAARLACLLPRAERRVIPAAGHMGPVMNAAATTEAVLDFAGR